ncbi:hypothetical protein [Lentzea aerocolonigenes]|uniref:hypothetical protein n=1 Tax=Lentzea aerocolonigenes TaxID=68170 RepID=UPI000A4480E8|nr:hypothetical protein [Lentzea aerocolonigenes]
MKLNTIARIVAAVILSLAGLALTGGAALADSCETGAPGGHNTNPFLPPFAVAP